MAQAKDEVFLFLLSIVPLQKYNSVTSLLPISWAIGWSMQHQIQILYATVKTLKERKGVAKW
jgi:hypothetical protein